MNCINNMAMRRIFILCTLVFVSLGSIQAMEVMTADQKRNARVIERQITAAFKQFDQGKKSFAELKKIIVDKTKKLRGFNAPALAEKYEQMLQVKGQKQPGPQQQQEKERSKKKQEIDNLKCEINEETRQLIEKRKIFDLEKILRRITRYATLTQDQKTFSEFYFQILLELGKRKDKRWYEELKNELNVAEETLIENKKLDELKQIRAKIEAFNNLYKKLYKDAYVTYGKRFMDLYNNVNNQIVIEEKESKPLLALGPKTFVKKANLVPITHFVVENQKEIGEQITILQLRNSGQIASKCGGISLYNGVLVYDYARTKNLASLESLTKMQHTNAFLTKFGCANWVSIKNVRAQIKQVGYDINSVGAVSNALVFDTDPFFLTYALDTEQKQYVNNVKKIIVDGLQKDYFFYVLIIGNIEELTGAYGHYFALVIIKSEGQKQYIVLDTLARNHLAEGTYLYRRLRYLIDQLEMEQSTFQIKGETMWAKLFGV